VSTRIIAVSNQKGGTAKTTTCINVAACLVEIGRRVLVVDLDPQANLTRGFGLHKSDDSVSAYDLIMGRVRAEETIQRGPVDNLDVIRSGIELAGAETELIGEIGRERRLQFALSSVSRNIYDYIIIDTPPNLGILMVNAISMATEVIIPTQPASFALSGLERLIGIIATIQERVNPELSTWRILLTMVDSRRNEDKLNRLTIRQRYESSVFSTEIRINTRLVEATRVGRPVLLYDRKSAGSQDYSELALEIEGFGAGADDKGWVEGGVVNA